MFTISISHQQLYGHKPEGTLHLAVSELKTECHCAQRIVLLRGTALRTLAILQHKQPLNTLFWIKIKISEIFARGSVGMCQLCAPEWQPGATRQSKGVPTWGHHLSHGHAKYLSGSVWRVQWRCPELFSPTATRILPSLQFPVAPREMCSSE
jgi:hypothetical protein